MTTAVKLLQHNFAALDAAIQSNCTLVAYDCHLYQAEQKLTYIHHMLNPFKKQKPVEQVIAYTIETFKTTVENWLSPLLKKYSDYLTNLTEGYKPSSIKEVRDQLILWQEATLFFLKHFNKKNPSKMYPFALSKWKELRRYQKIMQLEAITHGTIPMHDLKVMSSSSDEPSDHFFEWMNRFKELEGHTNRTEDFLKGLKACVEHISQYANSKYTYSLTRLQVSIWSSPFKSFMTQKDLSHIQWRNTLKPGDQLENYTLGEQLSKKTEDSKLIFVIDEKAVLIVAQNKAILPMRDYVVKQLAESIMASLLYVDSKGRFALMERIDDVDIPTVETITPSIEKLLSQKVKLIQHFLQMKWTPTIPLNYFRCDKEGKLKALKPFQQIDFDFNRIEEELILAPSQKNPVIYHYLAKASQIIHHDYAIFYQKVANCAFNQTDADVDNYGAAYGIGDGRIIERATQLYKEVSELRKKSTNISFGVGRILK